MMQPNTPDDIPPTHAKYTRADNISWREGIALWRYTRSIEASYLPDILIDRIHRFFQTLHINPVAHYGHNSPATMATRIPFDVSLKQTRGALTSICKDFSDIFDETLKHGKLAITDAPEGCTGYGYCTDDTVVWQRDFTINDVIYLPHEFGHCAGNLLSKEYPSVGFTEWQAHFMQHAQLDRLITQNILGSDITPILEQHRYLEGANHVLGFQKRIDASEALRNLTCKIENGPLNKLLYNAHYHPTAFFIAFALYQEWKTSGKERRERLVRTLFYAAPDTTPQSVLKSFDLWDGEKLERAMRITLAPIKKAADISPAASSLKLSL